MLHLEDSHSDWLDGDIDTAVNQRNNFISVPLIPLFDILSHVGEVLYQVFEYSIVQK